MTPGFGILFRGQSVPATGAAHQPRASLWSCINLGFCLVASTWFIKCARG